MPVRPWTEFSQEYPLEAIETMELHTLTRKNQTPSGMKRKKNTAMDPASAAQIKSRRLFAKLLKMVSGYSAAPDLSPLRKAYHYAEQAHLNQSRRSGEPYIEHCLGTALILADLRMDIATITAGLIHDVVEDTGRDIEEISRLFGDEIAHLVNGVTKISEIHMQNPVQQQAENFRKMIFSMAKDLRVIMIKFADRLHNMRTLQFLDPEKAKRIAAETLDVYAPLAHRFGIAKIKWELEDLSFKFLEPERYHEIVQRVAEQKEERERYIGSVIRRIKRELLKNGIHAEVMGRAKTYYSIYKKMKYRNKAFEEIYDLLAIRIIVEKLDECYFSLGVVHTLFSPVHDQFKDYIATPKRNMYRSLHTTVVGPDGKMLEIQLRTTEMHRIAEIGIAAHWRYKEGKTNVDELDRYSAWLRELVDWQKDTLDPEEYIDILKTDLYISEVFVFTPKGDLIKLPIGATPVDFAFFVHTDIGLHCIGAKVNSRIVPLNSQLKSGDVVEIITSQHQKPNQDWILFVKTAKAKSKIKRWFKEKQLLEAIHLGEEIFSKGMKRYHLQLSREELIELAHQMGRPSLEKLFEDIGQGELAFKKLLETIAPEKIKSAESHKKINILEKFVQKARGSAKGVRVQGMDRLLIHFAQCCNPVPGDGIIGFITKGRGIVIHRKNCINILKLMENPEKMVEVQWDVDGEESFLVQLSILAEGKKHLLKDITTALAAMDITIKKIEMNHENETITSYLILQVRDLTQLTKVMKNLCSVKGVLSVERGSTIDKVNHP